MQEKMAMIKEFRQLYGGSPTGLAYAPGRLEILGNHTDYNQGVVLSAAIDRGTFFALSPVGQGGDGVCRIHDLRSGDTVEFRLDQLEHPQAGDWANYVKGVIVELHKRGATVPPFQAAIRSTIPLSAGMSSSAALEMAAALALCKLAGLSLSTLELARIGQSCENNYVGARTGLMDQITSLNGRADHLVFSDFRSLAVTPVPMPSGVALIVANSMVKHVLTGAYNERRIRCEEAVAELARHWPGVQALRDVTRQQLDEYRPQLDATTYRRALHVVGENERVFAGIKALRRQDLEAFGGLLFASHESSRVNFENSCPELDALVELGKSLPGIVGARLSGGGFGGISVHLVRQEQAAEFARRLAAAWQSRTGRALDPIICRAADGGRLLEVAPDA